MIENEISYKIIGCALEVHKTLGAGLLEHAYEIALFHELSLQGMRVVRQASVPIMYKDAEIEVGFRLDLLVENKVIVEIKAVETLHPVHFAQTLTYLKFTDIKLGLLINFNTKFLKDNIHRVVNGI